MDLIARLKLEREGKLHGGIYDITQKRFAYNSNKIEGSRLTQEQTNLIFETQSIANIGQEGIKLDDLIESTNHFKCFDFILDSLEQELTQDYLKQLHAILKAGTSSQSNPLTPVGHYMVVDNEVGSIATVSAQHTEEAMLSLLIGYQSDSNKSLDQIVRFHVSFERIHPFADGNGRIGRLLAFKECLKNGLVPFIADDSNKLAYYGALANAQEKDEFSPLFAYFQEEQAFYANWLKAKGFTGPINEKLKSDEI